MRHLPRPLFLSCCTLPLIALAACGGGDQDAAPKEKDKPAVSLSIDGNALTGDNTVTIDEGGEDDEDDAPKLSLDLAGLKGQIDVPDVNIQPDTTEIGGIKLYPGTKIQNIDVRGGGAGRDGVSMRFASADAPQRLIEYYIREATDAGYTVNATSAAGGAQLVSATRADKDSVRFAINEQAGGSVGRIDVSGR